MVSENNNCYVSRFSLLRINYNLQLTIERLKESGNKLLVWVRYFWWDTISGSIAFQKEKKSVVFHAPTSFFLLSSFFPRSTRSLDMTHVYFGVC